jgi:hypothetical protein
MEYSEENKFQPKLVCNKGDMLLYEIMSPTLTNKAYNLKFDLKNLNTGKVDIDTFLSISIYELLETLNTELIEKIYILDILNENETDICILFKHIAKELGIKKKYIMFRTSKFVNKLNNSITFYNKDLIYAQKDLIQKYSDTINLDTSLYDVMIFNFGKTQINLYNNERQPFSIDSKNQPLIDAKFSMDFQLTIEDDVPIYMNNIIGLMFKKMFYNVKLFIEKL